MTERKNWLYPNASGLYFLHDGFIMRATDGKQYDIEEECDLLNELSDIVRQLKEQYDILERKKERYKRLSEIRNEEINNRILTIKEFIDDCSDEEVKKALKDLFYSEVNEYDLSKKYRKLHEENEVLKLENKMLKTTIGKNEAYIDRLTHKSDWSNNTKTSLRPKPVKNRRI